MYICWKHAIDFRSIRSHTNNHRIRTNEIATIKRLRVFKKKVTHNLNAVDGSFFQVHTREIDKLNNFRNFIMRMIILLSRAKYFPLKLS